MHATLQDIKVNRMGSHRRHLILRPVSRALTLGVFVFLVALIAIAGRASAQASCTPFGCFESGVEGQIWQSLPTFGHGNDFLACTNSLQFVGQTIVNPDPSNATLTPNSGITPVQDRICTYNDSGQLDPNGTHTGPPPLGSFL